MALFKYFKKEERFPLPGPLGPLSTKVQCENVFRMWSNGNNCKWVGTWCKFAKFIFMKNHNFTNSQKYPDVKLSQYTVVSIGVQ